MNLTFPFERLPRKFAIALCSLALIFCTARTASAQATWLRFYPTYGFNITHATVAPNGDQIIGGYSIDSGQTNYYFFIHRNDADGNPLWDKAVSFPGQTDAWCTFVENCPGGGIVAGGSAKVAGLRNQAVFRLSDAGDTLWTRMFWTGFEGGLFSATPTPDGNLLLAGHRRREALPFSPYAPTLMKINPADGSVIWSKYFPNHPQSEFGGGILIAPDSSILYTTATDTVFVRRLDTNGNVLWEKSILPIYFSDYGILRRPLADGFTMMQRWGDDLLFRRFDYNGNVLSSKTIKDMGYSLPASTQSGDSYAFAVGGFFAGTDTFPKFRKIDFAGNASPAVLPLKDLSTNLFFWAQTVEATPDGGFIIIGNLVGKAAFFVLKIDANGQFDAGNLSGKVFRDNDLDCVETPPGEPGLHPVVVRATDSDFGIEWFEKTDSSGHFLLRVPTGDFEIEALPPGGAGGLWEACPPQTASLQNLGDTLALDPLGLKPLADCPMLQLDLGAALFRPCSTTVLIVNVLNAGTTSADSSTVLLELDPLLHFDSSSIAPLAQNGNLFWFDAGALEALANTSFQVWVTVDCDAQMGQVLCVEGHVSPDSICAPSQNWNRAELKIRASCDGDSVQFRVSNVGSGNMNESAELVIIEDYIILRSVPLQLDAGQDTLISMPNPNNKTYYARIRQPEGFPGDVFASDGKDFCDGNGSPGMLLQYPLFGGGPFDARHCDEVRTSFDPNDKRGFPFGYGPNHYIERGTPIKYMIRFQNTGNDTAFNVVIRDVLPPQLDLSTLEIGAASHRPFDWELSSPNELIFRFPNILLPDSTTNEAASHGFVQFEIFPKKDLPAGTEVLNRAAIYFDFNAPVYTDYTRHTVDSNFIPTRIFEPSRPAQRISVAPNPAVEAVVLDFKTTPATGFPLQLTVTDVLGKTLRQEPVFGKKHTLLRGNLPAGVCFLKIENGKGVVLAAGKVVWEKGR